MADQNAILNQVVGTLINRLRGNTDRPRDAFFISFESTIAPAASDKQVFTMDNDADYLIVTAVGDVRDNAAPQTRMADAAISVLISQSQSGRQMMNIATHFANLFGTAQLHSDWPAPKYLAGGTTIAITQTNLLAAGTTYRSRITLWGYKLFSAGA